MNRSPRLRDGAATSNVAADWRADHLCHSAASFPAHGLELAGAANFGLAVRGKLGWARAASRLEPHADNQSFVLDLAQCLLLALLALGARILPDLNLEAADNPYMAVGYGVGLARALELIAEAQGPLDMCGLPPCRMQSASSSESPRNGIRQPFLCRTKLRLIVW